MCAGRRLAVTAVALGVLSACATATAPVNWLPAPCDVAVQGFGGWAEVRTRLGAPVARTDGELVALDRDTMFVLTATQLVAVPVASVVDVKLTAYRSGSSWLAAWTLLGVLSTASHGLVLILSAPLWVVVGSISTAAESYVPQETERGVAVARLRPFARFPQGMPAELDRASLTRWRGAGFQTLRRTCSSQG